MHIPTHARETPHSMLIPTVIEQTGRGERS